MRARQTGADQGPVISPQGRNSTVLVGLSRLASSVFILIALVSVAHMIEDAFGGAIVDGGRWTVPVLAAVAAALCAGAEVLVGGFGARREERRVRHSLLQAVFSSISRLQSNDAEFEESRLIGMMTDGAERLTEFRQVYLGSTLAALTIPFLVAGYIIAAVDVVVGLTIVGLFLLVPLLIGGFMMAFRKTSTESRRERDRLSGRYLDAIRNLVPIRLFGAGPRIEGDLRAQGERNRGAVMRLLARNQIVIIVTDGLFSLLLICATAGVVVLRARGGALTVGDALAIMLLTALLIEPLSQVAGFFYIGMGGMAAGRAIRTYLAANPPEKSRTDLSRNTDGLAGNDRAIEVIDLHFDYGRGPVLDGLSLSVPLGSKAAIVGRSGAGKSTFLEILRGSLRGQRGQVTVSGKDLQAMDSAERHRLTASVTQNTWLFTGSIADNLRIALPGATEEQMWEALERAQLDDVIRRMPQGLDTPVGEHGALLSGGEAQRLSLARALLSGRTVLLLDEPTSQVDIDSEKLLIDAIRDLGPDWTVVMATHRKRLLDAADTIWELAEGQLHPVLEGAAHE